MNIEKSCPPEFHAASMRRSALILLIVALLSFTAAKPCTNKKSDKKCERKFRKGKCEKKKIWHKKCRLACGACQTGGYTQGMLCKACAPRRFDNLTTYESDLSSRGVCQKKKKSGKFDHICVPVDGNSDGSDPCNSDFVHCFHFSPSPSTPSSCSTVGSSSACSMKLAPS